MRSTSQESRWVGRVLRDKWRIDARIARGGMGTVFAATHRNNGSTAAIKILHPEFSRDEDTRSRFLQEGYAANKVNHPGVVRILDDDVTEEGLAYLVMELLQGELLEQRRIRKGGKLPTVEVCEFADQLLDVLAAAHAKGIVHRDVKPDNIFLTSQGRLKVLDFGFAQMKTAYRPEQTATGFLLGTPGFMAPEQAVGNRPLIDARTDIWAVGATMFLLLSGQPVHAGESAAEQLVAAANFAVRSITTLEPALPTKLAHAIDRALAFDRDHRWPDARTMQEALRALPGKQAVREPIRSSIVDAEERSPFGQSRPVPPDDVTMQDLVDELEADDLQRTDETRAVGRDHASDREGPTVARPALFAHIHNADADGKTIAQESAPPRPAPSLRGHEFADLPIDVASEETLVMNGRPVRPPSARPPPLPRSAPPEYARAMPPPAPQAPAAPFGPPTPLYAMQPEAIRPPMFSASPAEPSLPLDAPAPLPVPLADARRGRRLLMFFALAGITMLLVIIAGLIVIVRSD